MRRRILDLFKSKNNRRKLVKAEPIKTSPAPKVNFKSVRSHKGPREYQNAHNQSQAQRSNAVAKRRKKNKVARKQRKLNRAA